MHAPVIMYSSCLEYIYGVCGLEVLLCLTRKVDIYLTGINSGSVYDPPVADLA